MLDGINLEELAREIAARLAPDALLDAADVGAILKFKATYVTNELQHNPRFPKPITFEKRSGGRTHPRWRRCDITEYIADNAAGVPKRPGRPRRRFEA